MSREARHLTATFRPGAFLPAPDGTEIDPFLNPADDGRDGPVPNLPEDVSVAAGRIRPGVTSAIHVHPVVTQITYVVSGRLTVRTRRPGATEPYALVAEAGEAVLTEPGNPVQFGNATRTDVHMLYIASPGYVNVRADGRTVYDDGVLLDDWSESLPDPESARASRAEALRRLSERRG